MSTRQKNTLLWMFFLLSFLGTNKIVAKVAPAYCALTFESATVGSRFGDNVYTCCKTKWFSYKYNIPFFAASFKHSTVFSIDEQERFLDSNLKSFFTHVVDIKTERDIVQALYTCKEPTLLKVGFGTDEQISSTLVRDLVWPTALENMYFFSREHPLFGLELKKTLTIKNPTFQVDLPPDKITVAVHVRKGSGPDSKTMSVQYRDEWEMINAHKIKNPNFRRSTDFAYPKKIPAEQFYVDQIVKLSFMLNHASLFVYVFTDGKNPEQIVERFKERINLSNISFACNVNDGSPRDEDRNAMAEDLYNMSRFDCLIKADSGFAFIAQMMGNHKIVLFPETARISFNSELNQFFIVIEDVCMVFHNPDQQTTKIFKCNTITEEHSNQASQLFKERRSKNVVS